MLQASATAPLADWFARLSDVAPDGTVTQITGAGINGAQRESMTEPRGPRTRQSLSARHHDAPDLVGLSQRPSHSPGDFECSVADGLAHAVFDDHIARTRKQRLAPGPAGRARERRSRSRIPAAATAEERKDIKSVGYPWPGEWTLERDEANHKATVRWKGKAETDYPWGKEVDYESLTYNVDDAHPETQPGARRSRKHFHIKGPGAQMARTFIRDHRPEEFLLQVHARVAERRSDGEAEDVGRNDSARPPVNKSCHPSAVSTALAVRASRGTCFRD